MGWEDDKDYTSNKALLKAEIENMTEEQAAFVLACMIAWAEQAENEEGAGA